MAPAEILSSIKLEQAINLEEFFVHYWVEFAFQLFPMLLVSSKLKSCAKKTSCHFLHIVPQQAPFFCKKCLAKIVLPQVENPMGYDQCELSCSCKALLAPLCINRWYFIFLTDQKMNEACCIMQESIPSFVVQLFFSRCTSEEPRAKVSLCAFNNYASSGMYIIHHRRSKTFKNGH